MRPISNGGTGGMGYRGMGHMDNRGTGGMGHMGNRGTGGMGYKGFGPHRQWGTWAMGYRGMGNGAPLPMCPIGHVTY